MLLALPPVDPNAPMSLAGFLAVIGLLISWVIFGFTIWNFRQQLRRRDQEESDRIKVLAKDVCEAFVKSEEHTIPRDRRSTELSRAVFEEMMTARIPRMNERIGEIVDLRIDQAFRNRAPSFVDSKVFERAEQAILNQVKGLQTRVDQNTAELGKLSGQITRDVVTAVAQQLAAFAAARGDKQPRADKMGPRSDDE